MMEVEWLACDDPQPMLEWYRREAAPVSKRKLALWVAALAKLNPKGWKTVELYQRWDRDEGHEGDEALDDAVAWAGPYEDCEGDPSLPVRADLLREVLGSPFR